MPTFQTSPRECLVRQRAQHPGRARGIAMGGQEAAHLELGAGAGGHLPIDFISRCSPNINVELVCSTSGTVAANLSGSPLYLGQCLRECVAPQAAAQATDLAPGQHDIQQPARCLAGSQAIHHRGLAGGITTARERRNDRVWLGAPKGSARARSAAARGIA